MEIDGKNHDAKFKIIKDRSSLLRKIKADNLRQDNEKIGDVIINKGSCYSFKKNDIDYEKNMYRKKFARKYQLPSIQKKIDKIVENCNTHLAYVPDHKKSIKSK